MYLKNEAGKISRDKRMINNEIKELIIENGKNDNRKFYKKLEHQLKLINQEIEISRLVMDQY